MKTFSTGSAMGLFRHPDRTGLEEEIAACVEMGKLTKEMASEASERVKECAHLSDALTWYLFSHLPVVPFAGPLDLFNIRN